MKRTALYRHYDADGRLLYVGVTDHMDVRQKAHAAASDWHKMTTRTEIEWCRSRQHALDLEAVAIRHEDPLHNVRAPAYRLASVKPVKGTVHPLLRDIEEFIAQADMSETYFGKRAANNSELVARLRAGGSVHFKTEDAIRKFIAENSPSSSASLQKAS